jgi:hypothetical protein
VTTAQHEDCNCADCQKRRRYDASLSRALRTIADRQAGRKRWKGAGQALTWYARTREAWASPKALTMRDEGNGTPSRGAESPSRRLFAAVAGGIKAAERDDLERHPTKPASVTRWVLEHFGAGRALTWMAEESNGRWTEVEMTGRMRRVCRVVRDHLRAGGWLDDGGDEDGGQAT